MPDRVDRPLADALDRAWAALLSDAATVTELDDLAPELAATLRRVQALDVAPTADPRFADQLWADLMRQQEDRVDRGLSAAPALAFLGASLPRDVAEPPAIPPRRRRLLASWATAALLLLAVGLALRAFGPWRLERGRPAMLPAPIASPAAASPATPSAVPPDVPLATVVLPADQLPRGRNSAWSLTDYTIAPGPPARWMPTGYCCAGPRIVYLLDGGLAIRPAAAAHVVRGRGDSTPANVAAGAEVRLGPGDALVLRVEDGFAATPTSATPAQVVDAILQATVPSGVENPVPASWIPHDQAVDNLAAPSGAAVLHLQRAILAPGGVLPLLPGAVADLAVTVPEDQPLARQTTGALSNTNAASLTLYVLSLATADATAPDVSLATITAPAGAIPTDMVGGLARYTVAPGSDARWRPTDYGAACCAGIRLDYILTGTYAVRSEGPMQRLRAGRNERIPAGTEVLLESGDAVQSSLADAFQATNRGQTPVTLLDAVLFHGTITDDPVPRDASGHRAWMYHSARDEDLVLAPQAVPATALVLQLTQATLAPASDRPLPPGAVVQLAVSLDPAQAVLRDPPEAAQPFRVRNLGSTPLPAYVLTLEPAPAAGDLASGTPAP